MIAFPQLNSLILLCQSSVQGVEDKQRLWAVKVLECLLDIASIRNANELRNSDKFSQGANDRERNIIRHSNGLASHFNAYNGDKDLFLETMRGFACQIELGLETIIGNGTAPHSHIHQRNFLNKISDSAAGCLEARIKEATKYLADPKETIHELFANFFQQNTKDKDFGLDLLLYLAPYIGNEYKEDRNPLGIAKKLTWQWIDWYVDTILHCRDELCHIELFSPTFFSPPPQQTVNKRWHAFFGSEDKAEQAQIAFIWLTRESHPGNGSLPVRCEKGKNGLKQFYLPLLKHQYEIYNHLLTNSKHMIDEFVLDTDNINSSTSSRSKVTHSNLVESCTNNVQELDCLSQDQKRQHAMQIALEKAAFDLSEECTNYLLDKASINTLPAWKRARAREKFEALLAAVSNKEMLTLREAAQMNTGIIHLLGLDRCFPGLSTGSHLFKSHG